MEVEDEVLPARRVCDELLANRQRQREVEARELGLVGELIDLYDSVDGVELPGSERMVPAGGDGTPEVAEFLPLELGPLIGASRAAAWALVNDVANLRHRHPRLWAAVHELVVPAWQARRIAQTVAAAQLDAEAALWLDQRLAPALGRLPWPRLRRKVEGLILQADKQLAARLLAVRTRERFVRIRHAGDGTSTVFARLSTPEAQQLQHAVDSLVRGAVLDGATGTPDALAADALVALSTPVDGGTLPRPEATLVVHVASPSVATAHGVARPERSDLGPMLMSQVRELLGHARVRVLPVIDLADDPQVDSYEIPARMREQVTVGEPTSVFPYSTTGSRACDLDHSQAWQPDGAPSQTRPSNLGPASRSEHRAKTHGGWRVDQLQPGSYLWSSPLGYCYLVDRHGTHRVLDLNTLDVLCEAVADLAGGRGVESLLGAHTAPAS